MWAKRLGALCLVVLVAGCSSSSTTKTIAKADFLQRANTDCRSYALEISTKSAQVDTTNNAAIDQFIVQVAIPRAKQLVDQLEALGYPPGDRAKLQSIYAKMRADVAKTEADPLADTGASAADAALTAYGLTDCAAPPATS